MSFGGGGDFTERHSPLSQTCLGHTWRTGFHFLPAEVHRRFMAGAKCGKKRPSLVGVQQTGKGEGQCGNSGKRGCPQVDVVMFLRCSPFGCKYKRTARCEGPEWRRREQLHFVVCTQASFVLYVFVCVCISVRVMFLLGEEEGLKYEICRGRRGLKRGLRRQKHFLPTTKSCRR